MRALTLLTALFFLGCPKKEAPSDGFDPAIDACKSNAECTLLHEDACCVQTNCDEDALAETTARTQKRHDLCAQKDCVAGKHPCSAKDVRFVAECTQGRCAVSRGR